MKSWNSKSRKKIIEFLEEVIDDLAGWGCYAEEYFQEKHDLSGDIKRIEGFIEEVKNIPVTYAICDGCGKSIQTSYCPHCQRLWES